jgi:hypothetical protein
VVSADHRLSNIGRYRRGEYPSAGTLGGRIWIRRLDVERIRCHLLVGRGGDAELVALENLRR